ncbi:MAG TPA: RNA polymerase-associated protein RapA [Pseudomonadales bacterium]
MSEFVTGQRWISNGEAGLGLGIVTEVDDRRVQLSFPAAGEERVYAMRNAPLTRIRYNAGDRVHNVDGESLGIVRVHEANGLFFYEVSNSSGDIIIMPELELDCFVHFNSPKDRLLSAQVDALKQFELRFDTREHRHRYRQSEAVGLLGPRVQLLPHQLYIARQVGSRLHPRVLLADEVGLGKTIEAGMILHKQLHSGMAERVLVVVPDSLLHQWLVEMLRRFNLVFTVLDEQQTAELAHDGANPFETSQLVLCPLSFLLHDEQRWQQAQAAGWDLLVVDEAHHLHWSPQQASPEYRCIEALTRVASGVLLLTATPEQLGLESHFARLRLLDPDRYFDFAAFVAEQEQYQPVNLLVQQLADHGEQQLPENLGDFLRAGELAAIEAQHQAGNTAEAVRQAMDALLDRHGTGRNLFRNTRAAVSGFPQRRLHRYPLDFLPAQNISAALEDWLQIEAVFGDDWLQLDARVSWLVDWLKQHRREKALLICARADTAIALEEFLRLRHGIRSAAFHEGMSLINRDRAAAYFADDDNAAQILLCSEIGSEGRNFQFAHHIILFDLPLNPDLLEQRIGRLDRIGQRADIEIHVPFYRDTPQQILLDWYHEALDAFEHTCAIGHSVFEQYRELLVDCLEGRDSGDVAALIDASRQRAGQLREQLHEGRDPLLEMNSCRPAVAQAIIEQILEAENRELLEDFVEQFADQLGLHLEMHSDDSIILHPSDHMQSGNLPGLPEDGITATYSRDKALSREDMAFLSWEHPLVQGAIDMILDSNHGNTAIGTLKLKALKPGTLLLESFYQLDCIAPKAWQLDRFLPTATVRTLVNLDGKDLADVMAHNKLSMLLERVPADSMAAIVRQAREPIEQLLAIAEQRAQARLPALLAEAEQAMQHTQQQEIARLQALAEVNPAIRADEIDYLQELTAAMQQALAQTGLRLDAVRLIIAV